MVVLDSSVIVAVLRDEADAATWAAALAQADQVTVAAPTAVEAAIVLGEERHGDLDDCFSYALATVSGQPLLVKGDDFTHTDVVAAALGDGGVTPGCR